MRQISPYEVLQTYVDTEAGSIIEPATATFTPLFLQATAVLSSYGDSRNADNVAFCAYALNSLEPNEREDFVQTYELQGRVISSILSLPEWPLKRAGVEGSEQ